MQPKRRSYTKIFKAQLIQESAQPDASIAGVAQRHGINANLLHKWIRLHPRQDLATASAFVPVKWQAPISSSEPATSVIHIEIAHARGTVVVDWPTDNAAACATLLRDLLR
ncbi:transposase [Pseudomonas sp.]|uniref:IS66-like element accessory protein TnpA n=1 Tax=Pseudomonas sp. TaxID=306 RepID=UPI002639621D|nr:transposase [Pseudomonas sp.]